MRRKLFFITGYFSSILIIITIFLVTSLYMSTQKNTYTIHRVNILPNSITYAAIPLSQEPFQVTVVGSDKRVEVLQNFFARYESPLQEYANTVVEASDKYQIDYRLIPAIAMQESTLCQKIPKNSYNCWGFGVYGGYAHKFSGYEEAINSVSKSLAQDYIAKGYTNPDEIMKKYTPSSDGSWADSVSYVMHRLAISL